MAPIVFFLVHHKRRECAWFFGGDERFRNPIPAGWEQLIPREVIKGEREFDAWIQLDIDGRLGGLCPPGYAAIGELR